MGPTACFKREHNNVFDPETTIKQLNLYVSVISFEKRVELNWGIPDQQHFDAFRVYRKGEGESEFTLLAELPATRLYYNDTTAIYNSTYYYYLTIKSGINESKPSETVSITPGPGYNWILDRWGYQLIQTTYDTKHLIKQYNLDWPPSDFALARDKNIIIITYVLGSLIEKIDTKNNLRIEAYYDAPRPDAVVYDSTGQTFWIADTTGSIIKTGVDASGFQMIDNTLSKPLWLSVAENSGIVSVVDIKKKMIIQYNRNGERIGEISRVNSKPLSGPEKFIIDERYGRIWLVDGDSTRDVLYSKHTEESQYIKIDSLDNIGDICLSPNDDSIYLVHLDGNFSQVLQLFPSGKRQVVVDNLYYPLSIAINSYDNSLCIADTYNSQVKHYDNEQNIIGILSNLVFPLKVIIE